ncbi:MAG: hypothetical protein ACI861_002666, partial [Paracoccaceae bacterium]
MGEIYATHFECRSVRSTKMPEIGAATQVEIAFQSAIPNGSVI